MPLLLLSACARSQCESLRAAVQRRSDAYGVYANEFADYEPVAFAALPLHSPMPVLHIVSSAPILVPSRRPHRPQTRRPPFDHVSQPSHDHYSHTHPSAYNHAPTTYNHMWAPYGHQQPLIYAASVAYPTYEPQPEPTTTEEPPTILYAKPKPQGGYTYYRRPTKKRNVPKKHEPVIIRVHKYKIIKGR